MHRILVFGAGRVAGPCVEYLSKFADLEITVVDKSIENAARVVANNPRSRAVAASEIGEFQKLIKETDVVINLLPPNFELGIIKVCIFEKKPLIGVNYVTDAIKSLDTEAVNSGIIVLEETGLDPGIDHMSAVRTIHKIKKERGIILGFYSWCGAIPAPESNTNPLGYKFSWFPTGAVGACVRPARYLREGKEVYIPGDSLMEHYSFKQFANMGWFEEHPNGNSLPYINLYELEGVREIYRGTIRYVGWCETMRKLVLLGLFSEEKRNLKGLSYRQFMANLIGCSNSDDLEKRIADFLKLDAYSTILKKIEWLGLLSEDALPFEYGSNRDVLIDIFLRKLQYEKNERDMIIMQHEYSVFFPEKNEKKKYISYMVDYGKVGEETSISRTTGVPPAIAARLIAEGKIQRKGVCIPVYEDIYNLILPELENMGIKFAEEEVMI